MNLLLTVLLLSARALLSDAYDTVCYQDLGCYTDAPPWGDTPVRPLEILPDDPSAVNTRFYLDTRRQSGYEIYYDNMDDIRDHSTFDNTKTTRFIIHGYIDNGDVSWMEDMSDAFLSVNNENVVRVGWIGASLQLNYASSAVDTQIVGAQTALMINNMISAFGMSPSQFHCIGHSLGAHTCGYVGDGVTNMDRITGLDPAGPYFEGGDAVIRLDETDASFVDVIHTDADKLIDFGFGTAQRSGDVDFWPNDGMQQPGCDQNALSTIVGIDGVVDGTRDFVACNHIRAIKFFTESITTNCFFDSYPCTNYDDFLAGHCLTCDGTNCPELGFHADAYKWFVDDDNTYLSTNSLSPFCAYMTQVDIVLGSNSKSVDGSLYLTLYGKTSNTEQEQLGGEEHVYELRPDGQYSELVYYRLNPNGVGEFSIDYVKLLWQQEEIAVTRQYITVEVIWVWVGSSQKQYYFCGDTGVEMSENLRYTFYPSC